MAATKLDVQTLAEQVLAAQDAAQHAAQDAAQHAAQALAPLAALHPGLDLPAAYAVARAVHARKLARCKALTWRRCSCFSATDLQRTPSLKAIIARSLFGSTGLISRW